MLQFPMDNRRLVALSVRVGFETQPFLCLGAAELVIKSAAWVWARGETRASGLEIGERGGAARYQHRSQRPIPVVVLVVVVRPPRPVFVSRAERCAAKPKVKLKRGPRATLQLLPSLRFACLLITGPYLPGPIGLPKCSFYSKINRDRRALLFEALCRNRGLLWRGRNRAGIRNLRRKTLVYQREDTWSTKLTFPASCKA